LNLDNLTLLMGFAWLGFSLSYLVLSWLGRMSRRFEAKAIPSTESSKAPVPLAVRLALSILGLTGALGTASLVGTFRSQIPWIDGAVLVGLFLGVLLAYLLDWRGVKSKG
jgi:hypothetical protein